jgi:UDP-arabinose 4-epimerase
MLVLVTGGAGYIGSHAAKRLSQVGHVPIVLDSLLHGHRDAVRWGPLIAGDLAHPAVLDELFRNYPIGAVMHFAALAYVGESMAAPAKYFRNNVANTLNLLDTMRRHSVGTLVFSSSCAVYGTPQARQPITEDTTPRPVNPYGESKLMVERILHWHAEAYGLKWTALRYFNAAGADPEGELGEQHDPEPHLIPRAIAAACGTIPPLEIFGTDYDTPDGTAVRDYVHVTDLAEAHTLALDRMRNGEPGGVFNLGTGRGHSVREVVRAVEVASGRKVPVRESGRRAGDPPVLVAEPRRARVVMGWSPRYSSLETIVETACKWHAAKTAEKTSAALSVAAT